MRLDQNKTHLSRSFFDQKEIADLESGKTILRVEPVSRGGQCYFIKKGGHHFATMQQVISWEAKK